MSRTNTENNVTSGQTLPNFDGMWNYADPAATAEVFQGILSEARESGNVPYVAELMTQIARTDSLRQRFDEAHAVLDEVETMIDESMPAARVRLLLERGRTINSSGHPKDSVPLFEEALAIARDAGLDFHAVDAAHMLGIVEEGERALEWNERAIALAEASSDPRARGWLGALYNNTGWTYHSMGRHEDALRLFEKHRDYRAGEKNDFQVGIALWSIAKMHRFLGRLEEALRMQREVLERPERKDKPAEGYTCEEIGECLLMLGESEEARPYFARAWELLGTDPWLQRNESERLQRLKDHAGLA